MLYFSETGERSSKPELLPCLNHYNSKESYNYFYFLPKQAVDPMRKEVVRGLKLTGKTAEFVTFKVPRKNDPDFSADLFPHHRSQKAAMTCEEWSKGADSDPLVELFHPEVPREDSKLRASSTAKQPPAPPKVEEKKTEEKPVVPEKKEEPKKEEPKPAAEVTKEAEKPAEVEPVPEVKAAEAKPVAPAKKPEEKPVAAPPNAEAQPIELDPSAVAMFLSLQGEDPGQVQAATKKVAAAPAQKEKPKVAEPAPAEPAPKFESQPAVKEEPIAKQEPAPATTVA